jgi:hypothetical protein
MAEVHVIGQLVGATGFKERNLFCKVRVVCPLCTRSCSLSPLNSVSAAGRELVGS